MNLIYDEMMDLCNQKEEFVAKVETVNGVDVTIFSYMVQMKDTFDSELSLEFRGTVFRNDTKECICRPLKKFFNLGERDLTIDNVDFSQASFFTKHDGSMATPVLIDGEVFWKTKKSFYSDVAKNIQKFYDDFIPEAKKQLIEILQEHTPIFEYVGPNNRIVLDYKEERLIPLGLRRYDTGEYTPINDNLQNVSYKEIYDMEEIEGFVVHVGDQIFKMKSRWYLDRHKIVTEFNPKNIIECTLNDSIDDVIGTVSQLGMNERKNQIEEIRDEVLHKWLEYKRRVETYWDNASHHSYDRKEFAMFVNDYVPMNLISIMFCKLDDKPFDDKLKKLVYNEVYLKYKP